MLVLRDYKGQTCCISAVLMNTVQQHKWRLLRKRKLQDKSATITTKSTQKSTNGSISLLTISEEHPHSGTPKYVKISSWTSSKKTESRSNKWPNVTVRTVTYSLLIGLYAAYVPFVDMKMHEAINVINAKSSLTTLPKWRITTALCVRTLQFSNKLCTTSLTCHKFRKNWKNGLMSQVTRVNGLRTQLLPPKHGPTWVSNQSA